MKIALGLYEKFTALDIIGPYQVLSALPGAETFFVAEKRGIVSDDSGAVRLEATRSFAEVHEADIVVVGGGPFTHTLIPAQHPIIAWLRDLHPRTKWTTSVCTGSLLLAAAGLLKDLDATTHWLMLDFLRRRASIIAGAFARRWTRWRVVEGCRSRTWRDLRVRDTVRGSQANAHAPAAGKGKDVPGMTRRSSTMGTTAPGIRLRAGSRWGRYTKLSTTRYTAQGRAPGKHGSGP